MKRLREHPEERKAFDSQAEELGGPLEAVIAMLQMWAELPAPIPNRGFVGQCAIMANEVAKVARAQTRRKSK